MNSKLVNGQSLDESLDISTELMLDELRFLVKDRPETTFKVRLITKYWFSISQFDNQPSRFCKDS